MTAWGGETMTAWYTGKLETAGEHSMRTGHLLFTRSQERDFEFFIQLYGRQPGETDLFIGILTCNLCGHELINR